MNWSKERPQVDGFYIWWSDGVYPPIGTVVVGIVNPGCGWTCQDGKTRGYTNTCGFYPPSYIGFPEVLWAKIEPLNTAAQGKPTRK